MAAADESLSNAGISPRERLARIETLLERIDRGLESKVDRVEYQELERRVWNIEMHGSPLAQRLLEELAKSTDRQDKSNEKTDALGRKLAYATGTIASIMVIVNAATVWFINH